MHDELDPDLVKVFAQAAEPLADGEFSVSLLQSIERARRTRVRRQVLMMAAVAIAVLLNATLVMEKTAVAVRLVGELSPVSVDLFTTSWGWIASLGIGAALLRHFRPFRR